MSYRAHLSPIVRALYSWILIAALSSSAWSARVIHGVQSYEVLAENATEESMSGNPEKKKVKGPARWLFKRAEWLLGMKPGTLADVNMARTTIAQRLTGRWFGVLDVGKHPEDFVVMDINPIASNEALHVKSNTGLEGAVSRQSVLEALEQDGKTAFEVQTPEGRTIMNIEFNVADNVFNSLFMVPSDVERTEDRDELVVLFKVSDWLGRQPSNLKVVETYNTLHTTALKLDGIPLPTPDEAMKLLPSAFDMPDWLRNSRGPKGEFSGGSVAFSSKPGQHEHNGTKKPKRSAMKGGRDQQAAEQAIEQEMQRDGVTAESLDAIVADKLAAGHVREDNAVVEEAKTLISELQAKRIRKRRRRKAKQSEDPGSVQAAETDLQFESIPFKTTPLKM